jgi:GNAT superfamily N-acetyltransferase
MEISTNPSPEDIALIGKHLRQFNESQIGPHLKQEFTICIRDEKTKQLQSGLYAFIRLGWLVVEYLWVDERLRHQGTGSKLLKQIEDIAQKKGIRQIRLNTGSFQALDFYRKHGYDVFTQLEITSDDGKHHVDYFLKKSFI